MLEKIEMTMDHVGNGVRTDRRVYMMDIQLAWTHDNLPFAPRIAHCFPSSSRVQIKSFNRCYKAIKGHEKSGQGSSLAKSKPVKGT